MEHRAAMNKFDQTRVSINDIKYDLIKIHVGVFQHPWINKAA
jgi:hypothetical protein